MRKSALLLVAQRWQSPNQCATLMGRSMHTPASQASQQQLQPLECRELQLPVPWGHVAAKWWGRRDVRPVLAVHGWQDNAGTFDRLIPLLPRHVGYLAIDLPGHGRSSHFGAGMTYSTIDFLHTFELIREQLGWKRVSLMAHSMGSQLSFVYAAVQPDVADLIIGIDVLKPMERRTPRIIRDIGTQLSQMMEDGRRRVAGSTPPCYTYEELVERMVKGTKGSVNAECAPHLLDRSIAPSPADPSKFYFSRDNRLKVMNYMVSYNAMTLEMAREIRAPHLFFKASDAPFYEDEKLFHEAVAVLRASNPLFRLVHAEGRHHVHLTDPEVISADVGAFLREHRPEGAEAK